MKGLEPEWSNPHIVTFSRRFSQLHRVNSKALLHEVQVPTVRCCTITAYRWTVCSLFPARMPWDFTTRMQLLCRRQQIFLPVALETMSTSPAGSPTSSDVEDVSTCVSSNQESLGSTGEIATSSDDDREPTPAQQPMQGRKRVRRSQNCLKDVRKCRRNAGKRYKSNTTKKMASLCYFSSRGIIKLRVGVILLGLRELRACCWIMSCIFLAKAPHKSLCQTLF